VKQLLRHGILRWISNRARRRFFHSGRTGNRRYLPQLLFGFLAFGGLALLARNDRVEVPDVAKPSLDACPQDVPVMNLCDRAAASLAEPICVEDRLYERQLEEKAAQLIEDGQTVAMSVLIEQLKRKRCRLRLSETPLPERSSVTLFQQAREAVVVVSGLYKCRHCSRWHSTTASGFVVTSAGAIVTNYHVVDNDDVETMVVMTSDRRVFPVREVLAANAADDLALLKIDARDLPSLPVASSFSDAPVGSSVGVVSHPDGRYYCYTSGVVSRYTKIRSEGELVDAVSITADYARGSSGAPVLNERGQVVGVVMSTESVYYTHNGNRQINLQMVFKTCVPTKSVWRMIEPDVLLDTAAAR
jgi:S1-C subfamily serine protease